jgi:hypothetical protein
MAPDAGVEEHFALLSVPPIRVVGTGDIRYERTVAAAVALPGSGRLYIRPGDPAVSVTREFAFADPDCRPDGSSRAGGPP